MKKLILFFIVAAIGAALPLSAQETVTGKVVDSNGQPILGAKVEASGTNDFVITNPDGTFTLNNTNSSQKLKVTYVGMRSVRVPVSSSDMVITMEDASQSGSERAMSGFFIGPNVTFSDNLNNPVYGASVGYMGNNVGCYIRSMFGNFHGSEEKSLGGYTFSEKHKLYSVVVGGIAKIYKPIHINFGAGVNVHKVSTKNFTQVDPSAKYIWGNSDGKDNYMLLDIGLVLKFRHIMVSGGTMLEFNDAKWYPTVGLYYCF